MNIKMGLLLAGLLALGMPGITPGGIGARADTGSRTQAMTPLRSMPAQASLVYDVLAGKDGYKLGQAVYTWRVTGERYHLESVAEAQGVATLFMSGRVVQTSEGRIGGLGLVPEQFVHTKKEKPKGSARFDWRTGRITMVHGTEPLPKGTQDVLSFPFQLALTVADNTESWPMSVTNGRYLKHYQFQVLGRERMQMGKGAVDVLHVRGSHSADDALDVWLAPDRNWLPLRIRMDDDKGVPMELKLVS
jgi:hypothetical protein